MIILKYKTKSSAFTIVELLVVIVVIGILAAITIVSYTGISSRATVSSLQSDLTNASTVLKLDYVSNGTFPATLASANGGKGITQSQTLDNITYIPDNTSNPSNFCLQYRKGNNNYAIDNNSAVTKGVCLQNLVTNGDFRDGTTGWATQTSSITVSNNEATITATASGGGVYPTVGVAIISGHKYYCRAKAITDTNQIYMVLSYAGSSTVYWGISPAYTMASMLVTAASTTSATFKFGDIRASSWTVFKVKEALVIDLTAAFGAGNEPTQASQMDTIINSLPNSWFNIVAKANL